MQKPRRLAMRVMARRVIKPVMFSALLLVLILSGLAGINPAKAEDLTKRADGIEAALKINASKNMVDLYLSDPDTSKPITETKVTASITNSRGQKNELELMGMRMGEAYSYMAMVDMSRKGRYIFDITVSGAKEAKFRFAYDVK